MLDKLQNTRFSSLKIHNYYKSWPQCHQMSARLSYVEPQWWVEGATEAGSRWSQALNLLYNILQLKFNTFIFLRRGLCMHIRNSNEQFNVAFQFYLHMSKNTYQQAVCDFWSTKHACAHYCSYMWVLRYCGVIVLLMNNDIQCDTALHSTVSCFPKFRMPSNKQHPSYQISYQYILQRSTFPSGCLWSSFGLILHDCRYPYWTR